MADHQVRPAATPPIEEDVVRQGVEFRLVDDVEVAQRHLLAGVEGHAPVVLDQQVVLGQRGDEGGGRGGLLLELAAEAQGVLDELGLGVVLEQRAAPRRPSAVRRLRRCRGRTRSSPAAPSG
jgi:hypothetical protein